MSAPLQYASVTAPRLVAALAFAFAARGLVHGWVGSWGAMVGFLFAAVTVLVVGWAGIELRRAVAGRRAL